MLCLVATIGRDEGVKMPVDDATPARAEDTTRAVRAADAAMSHPSPAADMATGIPIPKAVSVPSFYIATFALGVLIGMGIALYWYP